MDIGIAGTRSQMLPAIPDMAGKATGSFMDDSAWSSSSSSSVPTTLSERASNHQRVIFDFPDLLFLAPDHHRIGTSTSTSYNHHQQHHRHNRQSPMSGISRDKDYHSTSSTSGGQFVETGPPPMPTTSATTVTTRPVLSSSSPIPLLIDTSLLDISMVKQGVTTIIDARSLHRIRQNVRFARPSHGPSIDGMEGHVVRVDVSHRRSKHGAQSRKCDRSQRTLSCHVGNDGAAVDAAHNAGKRGAVPFPRGQGDHFAAPYFVHINLFSSEDAIDCRGLSRRGANPLRSWFCPNFCPHRMLGNRTARQRSFRNGSSIKMSKAISGRATRAGSGARTCCLRTIPSSLIGSRRPEFPGLSLICSFYEPESGRAIYSSSVKRIVRLLAWQSFQHLKDLVVTPYDHADVQQANDDCLAVLQQRSDEINDSRYSPLSIPFLWSEPANPNHK
jgi:hypothetical protein